MLFSFFRWASSGRPAMPGRDEGDGGGSGPPDRGSGPARGSCTHLPTDSQVGPSLFLSHCLSVSLEEGLVLHTGGRDRRGALVLTTSSLTFCLYLS